MKKEIKVLFESSNPLENNPLFASSYFIAAVEKLSKDLPIVITNNNLIENNIYEVVVSMNMEENDNRGLAKLDEIIDSTRKKYKDIEISTTDIPQISIVKATLEELGDLKIMALRIVKQMNENGLQLWNDYYPAEEFEDNIKQDRLYVCKEKDQMVGFFALFDEEESSSNFRWKYNHSKFLEMFAVNVDYLHKKYGQRILFELVEKLRIEGYDSLKLIVYEKNTAAISLYQKVGFEEVKGSYVFINKFRKEEPPRTMIGMEYSLK